MLVSLYTGMLITLPLSFPTHTHTDGLDMSNSSILAGAGLRGTTTNSFPYTRVPSDIREQWKVLEQAKGIPFHEWTVQHVVAWMETGLGESPSPQQLVSHCGHCMTSFLTGSVACVVHTVGIHTRLSRSFLDPQPLV